MSLSRVPNNWEWRRLHERLDRAVAEAASGYMLRLAAQHIKINVGKLSDELDELRFGREPDYELPGFPLVYALKYMPRRVVSVYGSLLRTLDGWCPSSVLDIGSGTGATALALELLNLPRHVNLIGVEPSREMIVFSECSRYRNRVSASYWQGSMADLAETNMSLEPFDLVVFSACLPYSFDDWNSVVPALGQSDGNESKMILVVEPDAKQELLTSFRHRLAARGWTTATFCCHDLPEVIKDDTLPLPEMQNVCRRLGLDGQPKTWWSPPNDRFLVANPTPAQAAMAEDVVARSEIDTCRAGVHHGQSSLSAQHSLSWLEAGCEMHPAIDPGPDGSLSCWGGWQFGRRTAIFGSSPLRYQIPTRRPKEEF